MYGNRKNVRRILSLFTAVMAMAALLLIPLAPPASAAERTGTISNVSSTVNVRSGPSTEYPVVASLSKGTTVTVTGETIGTSITEGGVSSSVWFAIRFKVGSSTVDGYVSSHYLESTWTGMVTASSVNVRSGPHTSDSVVTSLVKGATVTVTGVASGSSVSNNGQSSGVWYKVRFAESGTTATGYISSLFVSAKTSGGSSGGSNPNFASELASFPESYRAGLQALHEAYPAWSFKAQYVGYDWDYAVSLEYRDQYSLCSSASSSSWKCCESYAYNWDTGKWIAKDNGSWVDASRELIEYYMDPRNFLDSSTVFQFLDMSFDSSVQTVAGVQAILNGTFMEGELPDEPGVTFAQCIYEAAAQYGANPYVIAAKLKGEQGISGSAMTSGTYPGYEGYYNYFNFNAYGNGSSQIITRALTYAKNAGWDTHRKSIWGGTAQYVKDYIGYGQITTYLTRFDFADSTPCAFQYASAIHYAWYEGRSISGIYSEEDRAQALTFTIPVFQNMPASACRVPSGDTSPYVKLKSLTPSTGTLSPRFQPDTFSYTLTLPAGATSCRIDAVTMDGQAAVKGTGGANAGSTVTLTVTGRNGNTKNYTVKIVSSGPAHSGTFKMNMTTVGDTLPLTRTMTVADLMTDAVSCGYCAVYADGYVKTGAKAVCTGDVLVVYDDADESHGAYRIVLMGDLNKNGRINSKDMNLLFDFVTGKKEPDDLQLLAGDADGNGKLELQDISILYPDR